MTARSKLRVFKNHYQCDACDGQWETELLTVSADWCRCCDGLVEPYDSQEFEEEFVEEDA